MWWKKFLWVFLAISVAWFGRSILSADDNGLSVTAPTLLENGQPLTDLTSIRFYHRVNAGAYSVLATVPATVGQRVSYLHGNQTDGTHCYRATAVRAMQSLESVLSNEVCKTIDTILPSAPTDLAVN